MSKTVDELKPFKVYNSGQKLYLPITETDKQHGSIIFLMAPNHESALETMQLPYLVNRRYFESYYTEKDINLIINHESGVLEFVTEEDTLFDENTLALAEGSILDKIENDPGNQIHLKKNETRKKYMDYEKRFFKAHKSTQLKRYMNKFTKTGNFDKERKLLMDMVRENKTEQDIADFKRFKTDVLRLNKSILKIAQNHRNKLNPKDIEYHIDWINDVLTKAVSEREQEIKNSINESHSYLSTEEDRIISKIDPEYKSKGYKSLSEFKAIPMTVQNVKKYASNTKIDFSGDYKMNGTIWVDKDDNFVAIVNTAYYDHNGKYLPEIDTATYNKKDKGASWITGLEIASGYRNYGLAKQVLRYAMNKFHVSRLAVDRKNEVAIKTYQDMGFHVFDEREISYGMTTEKNVLKPTKESINEDRNFSSSLDPNYKSKGYISLSKFKKVPLTKENAKKYIKKAKLKFGEEDGVKGAIWVDNNGNYVGAVEAKYFSDTGEEFGNVLQSINSKTKGAIWITNLEVSNDYKNHGISKQLMKYAVTQLHATRLGVDPDNKVAIKIYKDCGFHVFVKNKRYYWMTTEKDKPEISITEDIDNYNFPNIMYFSSPSKITELKGRVFLSPHIAISSLFIVDRFNILKQYAAKVLGNDIYGMDCNIGYDEWDLPKDKLNNPVNMVRMKHNIRDITGVETGSSSGYIYSVDVSDVKDKLSSYNGSDIEKEVVYNGTKPLNIIKEIKHTVKWSLKFSEDEVKRHGEGSIIRESVSESNSQLSKSFKKKGHKTLATFIRHSIQDKSVNYFYQDPHHLMKHVRDTSSCNGYYYMDINAGSVIMAIINTEKKDNGLIWIQALEVSPEYQGYGLGKELLDVAVKKLHAEFLSVNKNNEVAIKMYEKYGFHTYKESGAMLFMTLRHKITEDNSDKVYSMPYNKTEVIESELSSKEKKSFDDDVYGLPTEKKYPMPDAAHVRSAMSYFHKCPEKDRKELAKNIKRRAKELGVNINPNNLVFKYINESHASLGTGIFLSETNMHGKELNPRIPSNYFTKNGYEDSTTPRICFAKSIDKALMGLSQNLKGKEFYVHTPIENTTYYKPNKKEVPDSEITGELWLKNPVTIKCIGKIQVIKDANKPAHKFTYGNNTAELYEWEWKWIERFNEEP